MGTRPGAIGLSTIASWLEAWLAVFLLMCLCLQYVLHSIRPRVGDTSPWFISENRLHAVQCVVLE